VLLLTINAGSSSIKFALFDATADMRRKIVHGEISRIGSPNSVFWLQETGQAEITSHLPVDSTHEAAAETLVAWLEKRRDSASFGAIAHRIVHGGPRFSAPQKITDEMLEALDHFRAADPEHLPQEILLIRAFQQRFPLVPQVACFDTDFHRGLPRVAKLLPIPRRYEAQGVRRYGFHGLSFTFLMSELTRLAGTSTSDGRIILAHLGNGASLAAVRQGKSIDTTMGFTPTSGLPMGTRSGDLDPGLFAYLARTEGMDTESFNDMIHFQSGLLGISETSSDMRDLLDKERTDSRAAEAIEMFCYHVKKNIGAFAAALGGVDALVFTGGIGENIQVIRARICEGLEFLGIDIDEDANLNNDGVISKETAPTQVRVIRTDEQQVMADSVMRYLSMVQAPGQTKHS